MKQNINAEMKPIKYSLFKPFFTISTSLTVNCDPSRLCSRRPKNNEHLGNSALNNAKYQNTSTKIQFKLIASGFMVPGLKVTTDGIRPTLFTKIRNTQHTQLGGTDLKIP
jgi:hypothetical protein